jgi:hypothetical protein
MVPVADLGHESQRCSLLVEFAVFAIKVLDGAQAARLVGAGRPSTKTNCYLHGYGEPELLPVPRDVLPLARIPCVDTGSRKSSLGVPAQTTAMWKCPPP